VKPAERLRAIFEFIELTAVLTMFIKSYGKIRTFEDDATESINCTTSCSYRWNLYFRLTLQRLGRTGKLSIFCHRADADGNQSINSLFLSDLRQIW